MNSTFAAALAAVLLAVPVSASAQAVHDHSSMAGSVAQPAKSAVAEGEVRKVDRTKGTVTIKHGPLVALNMAPMTMVFAAADPKMLANVKEGDKVRFTPAQGKDGQLTVVSIEVVK
jgi:Cu(I)/Ag(I) efflux system protein CusF